jgi:hypothetical protein
MTPEEGQILTGPQFSEPVRVETVRADGPGSWVLGDALHPDRHPSLKNRSTCSGTGESVETPMVSQMEDFTSSRAFRIAGAKAFAEARTTHQEFYCTGSRGGCRGHQAG